MAQNKTTIRLTFDPLDPQEVTALVEDAFCGAVAVFLGTVRDNRTGDSVRHLEYEAYVPLAEKEMTHIADEAVEHWAASVAFFHRLGRVEVGEASVVVAVSTAHRAEAFAAAQWVVDSLKARVPIWKKEFLASGAHWIEGPTRISGEPDATAGSSAVI